MQGDFHTHTTCSDGSTPIARLPSLAKAVGLDWLAITDHDSVQSVRFAMEHPVADGVHLVPATELSAYDFERGGRVHLLCYWPDDCAALREHCDFMRDARNKVGLQSCRELEKIFPQFRTEEALAYAADSGVMYKACMMRALMDLGLADRIYSNVYKSLFGTNPRGRVQHSTQYHSVAQVLEVIRASRGVAVVAHPSVYHSMPLVRELVAAGAVDGLEIEHPRNTPEDKAELYELAEKHHLIITGGTDYHGMNSKNPHPVGTCRTQGKMIERINRLAEKRKK